MNILCVFIILWCSGDVWGVQWSKCVQATQCLKQHGIKRHSAAWFLKRHGPWVIWICHLMPFNRRKYHLKLYQSDFGFFHGYVAHCCSS